MAEGKPFATANVKVTLPGAMTSQSGSKPMVTAT